MCVLVCFLAISVEWFFFQSIMIIYSYECTALSRNICRILFFSFSPHRSHRCAYLCAFLQHPSKFVLFLISQHRLHRSVYCCAVLTNLFYLQSTNIVCFMLICYCWFPYLWSKLLCVHHCTCHKQHSDRYCSVVYTTLFQLSSLSSLHFDWRAVWL